MAEGVQVYIDGKPAKKKVLLDTLYRPFRNAGRQFRRAVPDRRGRRTERRFRGLIDGVHVYGGCCSDRRSRRWHWANRWMRSRESRASERAEVEKDALRSYFLAERGACRKSDERLAKLAALRLEEEQLERTFPTVMVMAESPVRKADASAAPRRVR